MTKKPPIQINLTQEQFKALVEMAYLGNWMINAIHVDRIKKYDELEQHIYSYANEAGLQDSIEFDEEFKQYFPVKEFEEGILNTFKDEYDEETFWEDLIAELANRDLIRQYGEKAFNQLPKEKQFEARGAAEEKYSKEFERNGVENLIVAAQK